MSKQNIVISVILVVVVFYVGLIWGDSRGYKRSQAEVKKLQEEAAKKAGQEAAKSANPFQAVNPLEGVQTNPFEKAKSILNPFK